MSEQHAEMISGFLPRCHCLPLPVAGLVLPSDGINITESSEECGERLLQSVGGEQILSWWSLILDCRLPANLSLFCHAGE